MPRIAALGRHVVALSPDGAPLASVARDAIVVVGNGIHPAFHDVTTSRVALPMTGIVDSLNVTTAAAIVLWESYRPSSISSS